MSALVSEMETILSDYKQQSGSRRRTGEAQTALADLHGRLQAMANTAAAVTARGGGGGRGGSHGGGGGDAVGHHEIRHDGAEAPRGAWARGLRRWAEGGAPARLLEAEKEKRDWATAAGAAARHPLLLPPLLLLLPLSLRHRRPPPPPPPLLLPPPPPPPHLLI